ADALAVIAAALGEAKADGGAGLFGLVSARLTTEECWLARRLLGDFAGSPNLDFKPRTGEADGFLLLADRNPNAAGARLAGIAPRAGGFGLPGFAGAASAGRVKWAVIVGDDLDDRPDDLAALAKVPFVAVIGARDSETARRAAVVLPGAVWAEKDGTMVNADRRAQRLRTLVRAPGEARPESRHLLDLLRLCGVPDAPPADASAALVFKSMASEVPGLAGLTFAALGDEGVALPAAGGGAA
ncbi:MAG TPA: molybdopterin-dependent oxidoreductase, partial [Planctomycetota bacterium]|nr:molybdopterin-dependent oxidoreductase [Planctomycetota bacterium]